jgi:YD repeat-containing protein
LGRGRVNGEMGKRIGLLLLIASLPATGGCSLMIARSGLDLDRFKTREQVQGCFGHPITTGTEEGKTFECYRTHRKISDETGYKMNLGMGVAMTFGIGEVIAFPYELILVGRRTIVGQEVWFSYDEQGRVISRSLDDGPVFDPSKAHHDVPDQQDESQQRTQPPRPAESMPSNSS